MKDTPVLCPHTATTTRLDRTWHGRPTAARCVSCGHRARDITRDGRTVTPRQSRAVPSRWLTEHARRIAARRMGRRAAALRRVGLGLAPADACGHCGSTAHRSADCTDK